MNVCAREGCRERMGVRERKGEAIKVKSPEQ